MARMQGTFLLRNWLPVVVWIGIIVLESTDMMSAQHTGSWLYAICHAVFGSVNRAQFEIFHHVLRKLGHFVGYGTLAVLSFRAFRATFSNVYARSSGYARLWGSALLLTCSVASLDEWHQSFIPSRTASVRDVALDTLGGVALLLIAMLWMRRKRPVAAA